jgi:addiction module RelB/DinJ family antitoxin
MTKTIAITVRLDPQVKEDAQAILKELRLTTTQAVSLFFKRIIEGAAAQGNHRCQQLAQRRRLD